VGTVSRIGRDRGKELKDAPRELRIKNLQKKPNTLGGRGGIRELTTGKGGGKTPRNVFTQGLKRILPGPDGRPVNQKN